LGQKEDSKEGSFFGKEGLALSTFSKRPRQGRGAGGSGVLSERIVRRKKLF